MDVSFPAAHDTFQQSFHTLAAQIRSIHAEWQEAVRVQDRVRQSALIADFRGAKFCNNLG